jgi:hypothetical protein
MGAFAQNATVTANLKQLSGGASQPTGASIRVDLQNCTAPRVPGTGNIGEKTRTFYPNTSGIVAVTLYSNSVLDCGQGVLTNPVSFYTFNLVSNGQVTSLGSYKVPAGSTTLDTLTAINTTPVINTPTGDNSYLRLDLGNWGQLVQPLPPINTASLTTPLVTATTVNATTVTANSVNGVFYSKSGDTIASIESECSSACIYFVTNPQTITLGGNHTLSSNVQLYFMNGGVWTVNGSGSTLTLPGHVDGTISQHFTGTAAIKFGQNQPTANVEWFGAVGDGTTVDYTAIQATLNALTAGNALLQAKKYSIGTNTLSITTSAVGITGVASGIPNSAQYPTPTASQIVSNSTTADILDVSGTSTSNNITYNGFFNFTLARSVAPGANAAGMRLSFSYGAMIDGVVSMDSTAGFLFKGAGSQGTGYIQNSAASWGYNGVTETSGSLAGFQIDSTSGVASASLRIRHSFIAANPALSGTTTYGVLSNGSAMNDLMLDGVETATTNYGEFLQASSTAFGASSDIHILNAINDGCLTTCIFIQNIGGAAEVSGGWDFRQSSSSPAIDIRGSSHVDVTNLQIYFPTGAGAGLSASAGSGSLRISHNDFIVGSASAISFNGVSASEVSGNVMNGITATSIVSLVSSNGDVIANNTINGTATNGISIDAASNGIGGLETNQIGLVALGTITNAINNAGISPTTFLVGAQLGANGSIFSIRQQVRMSGSPLCSAAASGSCTFTLTFPKAFPNTSWMGHCMSEASTGAGAVITVANSGKTTTTATVTFRDFSAATNAITSAACEGWE